MRPFRTGRVGLLFAPGLLTVGWLVACGGSVVDTGERGAEPGFGGRAGSAGSFGVGASGGAAPGKGKPGSVDGKPGTPGEPIAQPTPVVQANGQIVADVGCGSGQHPDRPHSPGYQQSGFSSWIVLSTSADDRAGVLPSHLFGAVMVQSYAAPFLDDFVYFSPPAPVGGLRRRDNRYTTTIDPAGEVLLDDGVPAYALAVWNGFALRKRTGAQGGSIVERIDLEKKTVEQLGPAGIAPDREPGRLDIDGIPNLEGSTFVWSIQTGGPDSGLYRSPVGPGPVTFVAPGGNDDFMLLRGSVLRVIAKVLPDGRRTQTLESIPLSGGAPQTLFTIDAYAMTVPFDIDHRLYFAATFGPDEASKLLRVPTSGGTPIVIAHDICVADPWLPSLTSDAYKGGWICPGSGNVCTVIPRD